MDNIAEFCQKWNVTEFALFGSILREDFNGNSDVDVMVQFHPEAHPTLFDLAEMEEELKQLFATLDGIFDGFSVGGRD
ncbi:MAG: putative nucleotidyltransferase [Phormidium sp. OSCR]|nr:MAG: putative nucleotidyltransferase [Phormidium sp. OSCR]